MTNSLVFSMQLEDARRVEESLRETLLSNGHQTTHASDVEFLVDRCTRMVEMLDWGWDAVCREAMEGMIDEKQKIADELKTLFNTVLDSARRTCEKAVQITENSSEPVEGLVKLRMMIEEFERKRDHYLIRITLLDEAVIKEARDEFVQGDYPTASAALADLLAARHAIQILPAHSTLKEWAERSPPPDSWWNETDNPE